MSNVTLSIGGRDYTVSAGSGEEAHVAMLGRMIDDRLRASGNLTGQGEPRMLLVAALMLADELHEAHAKEPPPPPPEPVVSAKPGPEVVARVDALAARVEKLALHLEQLVQTP
jgi:cell division protein ZapA